MDKYHISVDVLARLKDDNEASKLALAIRACIDLHLRNNRAYAREEIRVSYIKEN